MLENHTEITGTWNLINGQIEADEMCKVIEQLISEKLVYLSVDNSGWYKLYKNEIDDSLWELSYPNSDLQGGGPPKLTKVLRDKFIEQKYSLPNEEV